MAENIFIGRKNELDILYDAYKEAENGKGKLVFVEGSAGIGKTGLVREFLQQIEQNAEVNSGVSECNDKENLNSYAPFKDILLELNAQSGEQKGTLKKDEKLKKLKQFVTEAGTSWIGLIPIVGGFASTGIDTYKAYKKTYDANPGADIESENDIYRIFENEFRRLAKENTIVVFIDDLQWADASSLNLIFALGKTIRANPFKILLICSYRHNEIKAGRNKISENGDTINVRHPFADKLNELRNYCKKENHISGNDNWFQEIAIKPLERSEMDKLVNIRFPNNQFSPDFFDSIDNITDRHPLYIVEILDYLQRNGIIVQSNGGFSAQKIKLDDLPVSVNAIINEKVERLDKELKKVLSYASVNGEEFSVQVIEKILKIDELDLLDYLEELSQKHGLLVAGEPLQVKDILLELYSFSQTLVHKFIYENMDGARRRALHRRIADTIKILYGEDLETNKEIKDKYNLHKQIGQGLIDGMNLQITKTEPIKEEENNDQVENFIKAAKAEIQNAKESFEQYAMEECYDHVNKALAFLSKLGDSISDMLIQKFEALLWKSKAEQWQGHYQKAFNTSKKMEEIATQLSNEELIARANLCIAKAGTELGNIDVAIPLLNKAIRIYASINNKALLWEAYRLSGQAKYTGATYDDAIELFKKSFSLAEEIHDEKKKAQNLRDIGKSFANKGEYNKGIEYYDQALIIFEKHNDQFNIGMVYNNIGLTLLNKGEYDKALEYFKNALKIAQDQNDRVNTSNRFNNIALANENKGEYDTAIEFYKKSLAIDISLDDKPMMSTSYNNIGLVYATKFEFDCSLEYLNKSLEICKSLNNKVKLATVYSSFGNAFITKGDNEKAIEYIKKSLEIDEELGDKLSSAVNSNNIGIAYKNMNDDDMAFRYYQKAASLYLEVDDKLSIALVNNNLAGISFSKGKNDEAIEFYEKAMDYYNQVDDKINQSLTGGNLAKCYRNMKNYDRAIEEFNKYIDIAEQLDEKDHLSTHYSALAGMYYEMLKYDEAIEIYQKSILINGALNKVDSLAENYRFVGYCYQDQGVNDEAINYLSKSLELGLQHYGEKNVGVAECYFYIGNSYYSQNQYDDAIINHQKALEIQIELLADDNSEVAYYHNNLGLDYYWDQQYDKAVGFLQKAFDIRIEKLGEQNDLTDHSRYVLGKAYYYLNRDDEAKAFILNSLNYRKDHFGEDNHQYIEGKEFFEKCFGEIDQTEVVGNAPPSSGYVKGADDNDIEEVKKNIDFQIEAGDECFENNNYKESSINYQEAIKTILEYFGEGYELVADLYRKSARNFLIEKQYESSIENYSEAVRIYKDLDENMDEMIAQCYRFLAYSHVDLKRYDEALSFYKAALDLYVKTLGEDCQEATDIKGSLEALHNLINSLTDEKGSEPQAQSQPNQDNSSINEEEAFRKIRALIESGDKLSKESNYQEAYNKYELGNEICNTLPDSDEKDKKKGYLLLKLGMASKDMKMYKEAEPYFNLAIDTFLEVYDDDSLDLARAYSHLGDVHYYTEAYEKAVKNHNKALSAYVNLYGNDQLLVAWSHYDLGVDYYKLRQYEPSISHFKNCLDIRLKLYGEEHEDVAVSYYRIGLSNHMNKNYEAAIINFLKAFEIRKTLFGIKSKDADNTRFALARAYFYADMKKQSKEYLIASRKFRRKTYGRDSAEYKRIIDFLDKI